ncbi:uncharacterized protein LOC114044127 [Vombatus ursinus]|uniref:uncharacterized protein LOC114044127 n=1 Tax=Vombatus ursinus TaxID=29139 RepID=UPI000FFD332E|nr:uncharacterized protein LOC114044127 [Vombatus ursinus]
MTTSVLQGQTLLSASPLPGSTRLEAWCRSRAGALHRGRNLPSRNRGNFLPSSPPPEDYNINLSIDTLGTVTTGGREESWRAPQMKVPNLGGRFRSRRKFISYPKESSTHWLALGGAEQGTEEKTPGSSASLGNRGRAGEKRSGAHTTGFKGVAQPTSTQRPLPPSQRTSERGGKKKKKEQEKGGGEKPVKGVTCPALPPTPGA